MINTISNIAADTISGMRKLLLMQYCISMSHRPTGVQVDAMNRLRALGIDTEPTTLVGSMKLTSVFSFAEAFLQLLKLLGNIPGEFQNAVSYAISDVYELAAGKVLNILLTNLKIANNDREKDKAIESSFVPIDIYIHLLIAIPEIAYRRVGGIGLWCMDTRGPAGRPSSKLRKDVDRIGMLLPYLPPQKAIRFQAALDLAMRALYVREESPLVKNCNTLLDVRIEQIVQAALVEHAISIFAGGRTPLWSEKIPDTVAPALSST
jgi:hypothetical protein